MSAPAVGQQVGVWGDVIPVSAHWLTNAVCGQKGRCLVAGTAPSTCCWVPVSGCPSAPQPP